MTVSIIDVMHDAELFGPWFEGDSWASWESFLAALFALPMSDEQRALALEHTGRTNLPIAACSEAWLCCGRRAGKSIIAALICLYLSCFRDYRQYLAPGELATVMLLAPDRKQARVVLRFIKGFAFGISALAGQVVRETRESLEFQNRTVVEIHTASHRTTRGYTLAGVILEEQAYWDTGEVAEPDAEIITALRPGMTTIPGALLLGLSSPHARRGELWRAQQAHFGNDSSPALFWNADSVTMNPRIDARIIEQAFERDPVAAASEFGRDGFVSFRTDVEGFLSLEVVENCTNTDRPAVLPRSGRNYVAFVDPSGGSSDSMTLAIAHQEGERIVLDGAWERRPPFSPDNVVTEFSEIVRAYGLRSVTGDRYAGEWPRERFRVHGITYKPCEKTKSQLYVELLSLMNSGRVELPNDARLLAQLQRLERRTMRGGRDVVDHPPGAHDDLANCAAGALVEASIRKPAAPWMISGSISPSGDERGWSQV